MMDDRELEKVLRSFRKMKAPSMLDEMMSPYLIRNKKARWNPGLVFIMGLFVIVLISVMLLKGNSNGFFYEPLYAAVTVPGYFNTSIDVESGDRLRVIFDGEVVRDTVFTGNETYTLEFNMSGGLHYLVIEIDDIFGNEKYMKTIDIYSL